MKINKKSNLPLWFDLSDYEFFERVDDDEMIYQLGCRANAIMTEEYNYENFFTQRLVSGRYQDITDSCMVQIDEEYPQSAARISGSRSIYPLTVGDVNHISSFFKSVHDIQLFDNDSVVPSENHLSAMDDALSVFYGVCCRIDLMKNDEQILYDMKSLLKKWRAELKFNNSPSIKTSWSVVRDKIILYKAIPLIDLMIWELATENKITDGVLAVTLFPEGEYDAIQIAQTIKPFAKQLSNNDNLEKFESEISMK